MSRFGDSLGCVARKNRGYRQNGSEVEDANVRNCAARGLTDGTADANP